MYRHGTLALLHKLHSCPFCQLMIIEGGGAVLIPLRLSCIDDDRELQLHWRTKAKTLDGPRPVTSAGTSPRGY